MNFIDINKDLEGKNIKLVNREMLESLGNGGEKFSEEFYNNLSLMTVKRVDVQGGSGWVSAIPVSLVDQATYDPVADSWDLEMPLVFEEVMKCYEIE